MSGEGTVAKPDNSLMNHWIVPPGHHVYTIHVHPFARGMELRDLTTGTTIFRFNSQDWPDRVGVAFVEEFKSIEGIPMQRDHRYELSAEYDNTLDVETDAMAILYLYFLEKDLT